MLCEKIKRVTKIETLANHPTKRCKNALKYYKAGHNNSQEVSFVIVIVGNIINVEEGR